MEEVLPWPRKNLSRRCYDSSKPKWHLSREGAAITGTYTDSTSETDLWRLKDHTKFTDHCQINTPASPAQALLPFGAEGASAGKKSTHKMGIEPAWPNPQGFCSSNLGPTQAPYTVVMATGQRVSPGLHLTLDPVPSSLAPPPTKVIVTSTYWRSDFAHIKSSCSIKAAGHPQTV